MLPAPPHNRGREGGGEREVEWIPPVEIIGYYHNLAMIYKAQEKYQQALSLFSQALQMSHTEDQRLMAISLSSPSSPLSSSTLSSSSSLSSSSRCDPRSRSMTIHLLNGLASCHNSLKNFQEAERCYEQCIEWNQEVYGPNHDKTLASLSTLGKFYKKSKRFVERGEVKGEEICEVCYERTKEKYGEDHEKTLKALKSFIEISESNGKKRQDDTKSSVSESVRRR
jgi:tetratricopeptide (TPR) repeat protein